ncbi:hypothetical protein ABPG75_001719 [Micractinium tetrahymenae]
MTKAARTGAAAPPAPAGAAGTEEARIKALYSIMQSIENKLGGGEGVEGLYGSIKKSGMDRVLACMRQECRLDARSVLVDVGAGLGRPLMHALLWPGIAGARGIEIDRIKCDKAAAFLRQAIAELARRGVVQAGQVAPPEIECSAIEQVRSLDPCTHAYSFWEGVPVEGKAGFGRLFAASRTLRSVAVVQRAIRTCPVEYMADLGFGELLLVDSFSVSMSGSGRSFTAYVFNKAAPPLALPAPLAAEAAAAHSVETPAQAAEAAVAAPSSVAGQVADEVEGETAQSRLAEEAAAPAVPGGGAGRGRRERKPSAKQQAAAEAEQGLAAAQAPAGREPRSARQPRAAQLVRQPEQQQPEQQEVQPPQLSQQVVAAVQAAEPAAAPLRSPRRSGRSIPRLGAAAASTAKLTAPPAAKLSSPQRAGVQKRCSPAKAAAGVAAALPPTARRSPRQLALSGATAAKGAGVEELLPARGTGGPLLQQGIVRVVKAGAAAAGKAVQTVTRRSARRGLLEGN